MARKSNYIINRKNTELWKEDTLKSVSLYNDWFLNFAPATYTKERKCAMEQVGLAISQTDNFHFTTTHLKEHPEFITILRMATTPPIARDRLIGFSGIKASFLKNMEEGRLPQRLSEEEKEDCLNRVAHVLNKLLDIELFSWIQKGNTPTVEELKIAECIVADRLCGTLSNPIIRNEQEKRQLKVISDFLVSEGYTFVDSKNVVSFSEMKQGTFSYHLNVPVKMSRLGVNMPIDVVIKRKGCSEDTLPLLVECKSAGDFTNTNKRRKEEAQKIEQLKSTYGNNVDFVLFLCGYFDSGYLGYEAAEGIDWIWEHRVTDFKKAGV